MAHLFVSNTAQRKVLFLPLSPNWPFSEQVNFSFSSFLPLSPFPFLIPLHYITNCLPVWIVFRSRFSFSHYCFTLSNIHHHKHDICNTLHHTTQTTQHTQIQTSTPHQIHKCQCTTITQNSTTPQNATSFLFRFFHAPIIPSSLLPYTNN